MNSFGRIFRIHIFGESHGRQIGVVMDGVPAGIPIKISDFKSDLQRRKSGLPGTTSRSEPDLPEIISGVFNDFTTGAPLLVSFGNSKFSSAEYERFRNIPRPGHADFVAQKKYSGYNDPRGSGHFSGRITLGLVSAGVVAKKILSPLKTEARLIKAGADSNVEAAVGRALEKKDSIGGLIECSCRNVPVGLGEPFFDSVESCISHAVFAIPGIRGIEFGTGFRAADMWGSEHNDQITNDKGTTKTNHCGGVNGGISNGNEIVFRVAVKPTSSIYSTQKTFDLENKVFSDLKITGDHDSCFALRVPPIIEAAAAVALADFFLLKNSFNRAD